MINVADIDLPASHARALDLRMAPEAEVRIALDQQLGVDAAMRVMAGGAAFPQRWMLKDEGSGLLPVALSAGFVQTRDCQPAGWLEDVAAMRIVALRAVHLLLQHRVVLRKLKFRLLLAMALETSCGAFAGIDDELASPAPS